MNSICVTAQAGPVWMKILLTIQLNLSGRIPRKIQNYHCIFNNYSTRARWISNDR